MKHNANRHELVAYLSRCNCAPNSIRTVWSPLSERFHKIAPWRLSIPCLSSNTDNRDTQKAQNHGDHLQALWNSPTFLQLFIALFPMLLTSHSHMAILLLPTPAVSMAWEWAEERFCSRGPRANYTKYISTRNIHYIWGVWAEPQPTNDLVHFSFKIRHLVATILIIFSHGQRERRDWGLI